MINRPAFMGLRSSGGNVPLSAESLAYKADRVPGISDASLAAINRFIESLKGNPVPGLRTLSRNIYQYCAEIYFPGGKYQTMAGGFGALNYLTEIKGFKGAHNLTGTGLTWASEGIRFHSNNYPGESGVAGTRRLMTSGRVLQDNDRWSCLYFGNFPRYTAAQQYGLCQSTGSADGSPQVFGNNGTSGVITDSLGTGTAYSVKMRAFMSVQDDTHKRLFLDGNPVEATSKPHTPATYENCAFVVGNLSGPSWARQIDGGTFAGLIIVRDGAAANAVISGNDFECIVENWERCFKIGMHGKGKVRPLPSGRFHREMALTTLGTGGASRFIGTPNLIEWPAGSGNLVASHDQWGAGSNLARCSIYRRDAGAAQWSFVANVDNMIFGRFLIDGAGRLHLLGCTTDGSANQLVVRRCNGTLDSWSTATVLDNNGQGIPAASFASSAMAPCVHDGRMYCAIETVAESGGGAVNQWRPDGTLVVSTDMDDDWLSAASWYGSNRVATTNDLRGLIQGTAPDSSVGKETLEHELVVHDGEILGFGRTLYMGEVASTWTFDPTVNAPNGELTCSGGNTSLVAGFSKFRILRCPVTGWWLCLGNKMHLDVAAAWYDDRTQPVILKSSDLTTWTVAKVIEDFGKYDAQERGLHYFSGVIVESTGILHLLGRLGGTGSIGYHDTDGIIEVPIENYVEDLGLTPL